MRYQDIIKKLSGTFITDLPGVSTIHNLINNFIIWKHQMTTGDDRIEYNGATLYADTSDRIARDLITYGEYESKISDLINNHLKAGDFAIDIGGHIGHHSITMRQSVGHQGTVWVFEPYPKNADHIEKTISENNWNNVKLFPVALSDTESNDELLLTNSGNTGKATLNSENLHVGQERKMEQKYSVETKRLTSILEQEGMSAVDLIKIDIEGGESSVITELEDFLHNIRMIIFEFHPAKLSQKEIRETLHILDDNGDIFDIDGNHVQMDQPRKERMHLIWKSSG